MVEQKYAGSTVGAQEREGGSGEVSKGKLQSVGVLKDGQERTSVMD